MRVTVTAIRTFAELQERLGFHFAPVGVAERGAPGRWRLVYDRVMVTAGTRDTLTTQPGEATNEPGGSAGGAAAVAEAAARPARWVLPPLRETSAALAQLRQYPPLLARLLVQRGVESADAAEAFLRPRLTHLQDPASLPGCAAAADRLCHAIHDRQPVVIYGDYDVDGVTATAILWHTLRALGHTDLTTYVPHRLDEGYGLNIEAIEQFAGRDPRPLIVTVDCGITAVAAAARAAELGLDLIITDHHQFDPEALPAAAALVHPELAIDQSTTPAAEAGRDEAEPPASPNQKSSIKHQKSPSPSPLCGAGVAFKLAWQVARTRCGSDRLPADLQRLMLDLLAFAALGTVADVVPLVGENRVIVTHGLSRIKETPFNGLNELIDAAELRSEKVDAVHVGFVLGPRLNACGRMGHASQAVELLTDASPQHAKELARFLTRENGRRRTTERRILAQAREMVLERGDDRDERRVIVLAHPEWHPGVIGIVASRLVEQFHRPVVLLGIDEAKGEAKGSARSVEGLDLHAAIGRCGHHCTKFGGHAMAAGLTLPPGSVVAFRDDLVAVVNRQLEAEDLAPRVAVDLDVPLSDCVLPIFEQLQRLAPFGRSNPMPRLLIRDVIVARSALRMGGEGTHLSVSLRDDEGHGLRAVGFGLGDRVEEMPAGARVDIVCKPQTNTWRGVTTAELHLVDVRPAGRNRTQEQA